MPINKGFQDTKNNFISNAQKYRKNKITFTKKLKKKRSRIWFFEELNITSKKALTTFLRRKREVEDKSYFSFKNYIFLLSNDIKIK